MLISWCSYSECCWVAVVVRIIVLFIIIIFGVSECE
jgi:uncharacterized integral membrane protein